jgi:hypothetical protein
MNIKQEEAIKVGSIVKMSFTTYASEVNENWTIIKRYIVEDEEMVHYIADCRVCNVTAKFFQVIIPHNNGASVRISKRCFSDTKNSYADMNGFRPYLVMI